MLDEDSLSKRAFWQELEVEKYLLGKKVMEQFVWIRANFILFGKARIEEGRPILPHTHDTEDEFGYFWGVYAEQLPGIEWALVVALHTNAFFANETCFGEYLFIPSVKVIAWKWEKESWDSLLLGNERSNQEFFVKPDDISRDLKYYNCVYELKDYAVHQGDAKWIERQLRLNIIKAVEEIRQSVP